MAGIDPGRFFKELARKPWVLISAMAHVIVLAVISVIVFANEQKSEEMATMEMRVSAAEDKKEEIKPPEVVDRQEVPKLQDNEIEKNDLTQWMDMKDPEQGDPNTELSEMPAGDTTGGTAIGLTGPGHHGIAPSAFGGAKLGGKYGSRFGTGDGKGRPGGSATAEAVRDALAWLKKHQDDDGHWSAAEFMKHDVEGVPCDGPGNPTNDIGVTGLALLAFLGDGHTMRQGLYKEVVRKAVLYLKEQQGEDGLFGMKSSHDFIYSHVIASLAMCEAYGLSDVKALKVVAQKSINYLQQARNPYKVWRYFPRDGDNDTSVTGWCVLALESAREFKLTVDEEAFKYAQMWFDEVTDPTTGAAGYTKRGEGSSRPTTKIDKFPHAKTQSLTAVALLSRFFIGEDPKTHPIMTASADAMLKLPPKWDETDGSIDMYYWYYGSFALFQYGGRHWEDWKRKMEPAVLKSQRKDANFKGSWDPKDAWGENGGRVYSTAIMCLCLEVYYRYARILGGR